MEQFLVAVLTMALGVGGAAAYFVGANWLLDRLFPTVGFEDETALRNHRVMMGLIALAAGTLLGDSFMHLLPEAAHDGFSTQLGMYVLGGFLIMFALESLLHRSHSHGEHVDEHAHGHVKPFGWTNLAGDALHNFIDGVIIAAAFLVDVHAGIATTVAVLAHEVPTELGDFAVLVRSGMPVKKALLLNFGSALFAFLGAGLVLSFDIHIEALESTVIPLIAGAFIYIAAADLVPELHHHSHRRDIAVIVIGLLVGLALMFALLGLEGALPGDAGHSH